MLGIDGRSIQLEDRVFKAPRPVLSCLQIGDRIVVRTADDKKGRRIDLVVPVDRASFAARGGKVYTAIVDVAMGTEIGLDANLLNRINFPDGHVVDLPWEVRTVTELSGGFAVITVDDESPRNLFMLDKRGDLVWQVQENVFRPRAKAGYAEIRDIGGGLLEGASDWELGGTFMLDAASGRVMRPVPPGGTPG